MYIHLYENLFFHFLVHCSEEEEIQDCHFQRLVKSPKTIYNTKEIIPLIATLTSSTAETEEESEEHMLLQHYRRRSYILLQNQDITRAQ